jgi:hypothetical protein
VGGTAGGMGDEFNIVQQCALGRCQARFLELALENRRDALIAGSLDPQEVGMTIQSIRAPVEEGDVAGNHLLVASDEVAFGEMNGIGKIHDLP